MKIWEIVKKMCEDKYEEGQMFQNADMGDMVIDDMELVWINSKEPVSMISGDDSDWEELWYETVYRS